MKRTVILLLMIALLPAFAVAKEATKYTCPMHPHYIADAPGACPICGMDLVPVTRVRAQSDSGEVPADNGKGKGKGRILYYKHPMGKPDTSPVPKKDEMGMDYIPVYESEVSDVVAIAPETIQNMGVRTVPAEMTVFGRTVRAFGAVTENTRLQSVVSARVEGWIEGLAVNAVGDAVKKGDVLFRLYSPDLIAAQRDYLSALSSGSTGRAASSARRLESLGVRKPTIETLRRTRKALERVPVLAAHDGIVSRIEAREGAFVKPGAPIAVIQDYSSVWVSVSVAEKDLALLSQGVTAHVDFPALPGRTLSGTVDYVHPTVDPESRTGRVRLVLDNPRGSLRPGAYADVTFDVERRKRLAVPSEAVLRDSRGAHVVVALGEGRFRPHPVRTGIVSEGRTEILDGLAGGEEIVVSGQFLIDSESAMREALAKMQGPEKSLSGMELTGTELSLMDHFVDAALYLHETMTKGDDVTPDHLDAALRAGARLETRFGGTRLAPILNEASGAVRAAQKARTGQELDAALADLVAALRPWLVEGRPDYYRQKGVRLVSDPESRRLWLQRGKTLRNPYSRRPREIPLPENGAKEQETSDGEQP